MKKCLFCGSSSLRADRALSGRIICTSCGKPYGARKVNSNKMPILYSINKKKLFFIVIIIVVFIVLI